MKEKSRGLFICSIPETQSGKQTLVTASLISDQILATTAWNGLTRILLLGPHLQVVSLSPFYCSANHV